MKQTHLPKQNSQRLSLLKKLENKLQQLKYSQNELEDDHQLSHKIAILELRIKLIQTYASDTLTLDRIGHLQQIFKHYCTHIFKIGKHMTFQRLEYEKVHLTLDRFLILLKDFGLTTAKFYISAETGQPQVQYEKSKEQSQLNQKLGIKKQQIKDFDIIQKNQIIKMFKRISENSRDLSFEGFISAIEKLAIIYYDDKETFVNKLKMKNQQRQNRIREYREKMKKKEMESKLLEKQQNQGQKLDEEGKKEGQNQNNEFDDGEKENGEKEDGNENDDLVENMMKDENLEDPNEEVIKAVNKSNLKGKKSGVRKKKITENTLVNLEQEFVLTKQEKIQFYYNLIGVDNVHDFRKRMSELGLPLFKAPKKSSSSKATKNQITVTFQQSDKEQNLRLIQLRQKLQQKKLKQRQMHGPLLTKQQYQERKKRRQQKQNELLQQSTVERTKNASFARQRKIDFSDKEISWDFVNKLEYNDLKVRADMDKILGLDDEEDKAYLEEYNLKTVKSKTQKMKNSKVQRSRSIAGQSFGEKTLSRIEMGHKRDGSEIISDFKKRAKEVEIRESDRQAKLSRFLGNARKQQKKFGNNMYRFS